MSALLEKRRSDYFRLNSALSQLSNAQLEAIFDSSKTERGWGQNHVIEVDGTKVFVKRVPLTELEFANQFSTRNLYNLPTYYNYGVGSAGFGVFRELLTHIKTTNWVLAGETENFPLLYHYRIMAATGEPGGITAEQLQRYIERWNSSEAVGRFVQARIDASHQVVLFLEYIPYPLDPWFLKNPQGLEMILENTRVATAFLRSKGVLHFDANFDNVLTDGERLYLTDFGLTIDRNFELSEAELEFFNQHQFYDDGEMLVCVGSHLTTIFRSLPDEQQQTIRQKYGVANDLKPYEFFPTLLNHIEEMAATGLIALRPEYVATLVCFRELILLMQNFYMEMRPNPHKDTKFEHDRLVRLLRESSFISV